MDVRPRPYVPHLDLISQADMVEYHTQKISGVDDGLIFNYREFEWSIVDLYAMLNGLMCPGTACTTD